ncbi:hypothetical protein T492DRAFT_969964 [Pavlovales sp. CCMP2436]|nr:hypothetical protein T492DRAFT_969964 [Pavlovales sp. CCMP2436]
MWRAIPLVMLFAAPTCGMRAPGAAHVRIVSRVCLRAAVAMGKAPDADTEEALYPKYIKERKDSGEDVNGVYSDLGVESDFDGGDSGSGAVGDGQVTLDNQHDSPFLVGGGGLRDSIEGMAAMNSNSKYDDVPDEGADGNSVEGATSARDSKQKNYWGRQIGTGYADELAKKGLAFAPFHVSMTADSPKSMSVTPTTGVMEKRFSEKAVELIVRFTPDAYGIPVIGTLIFETEDFRKVFKIVGKTAN